MSSVISTNKHFHRIEDNDRTNDKDCVQPGKLFTVTENTLLLLFLDSFFVLEELFILLEIMSESEDILKKYTLRTICK